MFTFNKRKILCVKNKCKSYSTKKKIQSDVGLKENLQLKPFSEIPGPVCLPIIGNLYQYKLGIYNISKYHEVLNQLYKKYGPIVKEKLGSRTIIHLFSPDDAKIVYSAEGKMPYVTPLQETVQLYRQSKEFSPGLGNTNGETWYRLRNAIRHMMLQPSDVQQYLPGVQEIADDLIDALFKKMDSNFQVATLRDELGKFSQEAAGYICFDRRLGYFSAEKSKLVNDILKANQTVFHLSAALKFSLQFYKYWSTLKWNKLVKAENVIMRSAMQYVNETIDNLKKLEESGSLQNDRYPFMKSLLAKKELSLEDVAVIVVSMYSDGLSTNVPSLLFNLYCLATNEDVQEKAYEEIKEVTNGSNTITASMLGRLSYLKAVIKETFRMLPNGTEISRILKTDLVLSDFLVPAETDVAINMSVHFKSEEHFKNPKIFYPDRWLRGNEGSKIHPFLLTPFGYGTRTCAGRRFAEQEMTVTLAKILKTFKLKYPAKEKPLEVEYNTLLFPKEPLKVQFIPR